MRRTMTAVVAGTALALLATACSSGASSTTSRSTTAANSAGPQSQTGSASAAPSGAGTSSAPATSGKKFKIALSNSYIGNTWRVGMENEFKSACAMPPLNDQVECSVFNANNDVNAQKQQISSLITSGVDAILVDAASPTGLNGVIQQACDHKILVISFDNTVTADCGLQVELDETAFGQLLAQWLAQQMNGKGNVLMVTGVAGTTDDTDRNNGAEAVWKNYPGIHVVSKISGKWDSQVALRAVSAALPSLPQIDGIWVQAGTNGVLQAFQNAGRALPPTAGEAENGFRKLMGENKVQGYSIGDPPYLSVIALGMAEEVLSGKYPHKNFSIPLKTSAVTNANNREGQTWFKSAADDFFSDIANNNPGSPVTGLCLAGAQTGKPCPGNITFDFSSSQS